MLSTVVRFGQSLSRGIATRIRYSESNLASIGWIGAGGFPLYYFVWHDWFPQPYENLPLRLLGCALFLPLTVIGRWPPGLRKYFPLYWYAAILFALPFFFTFMLFKNGGTHVWLMSVMVAVFLLSLAVDWLSFIVQSVLGAVLAWLAYVLTTEQLHPLAPYLESLPIFAFAIVATSVFNYNAEFIKRERLQAMLSLGGYLAHELRTPLLGIRAGAAGLKHYLPTLLEVYALAQKQGLEVPKIRKGHFDTLGPVLERIEAETDYSNTIIDMLLMSVDKNVVRRAQFAVHSIADCVDRTLSRYPFKSEQERRTVQWYRDADFRFYGSDLLVTHVLFNLLKNALYSVEKAGKGDIVIWLSHENGCGELHFRDTGMGIARDVLPHVFEAFYSNSRVGKGTGIGLSFCRMVMESLGGRITVKSQYGEYAEFVLTFKGVDDERKL